MQLSFAEHTFLLHLISPNEDDRVSNLQQSTLRVLAVGKLYSPVNEEPQRLSIVGQITELIVTLIGVSGIGLWSVKALCWSGFRNIKIINRNDIYVSNSNSQLHAFWGPIGKFGTCVMKGCLQDIKSWL